MTRLNLLLSLLFCLGPFAVSSSGAEPSAVSEAEKKFKPLSLEELETLGMDARAIEEVKSIRALKTEVTGKLEELLNLGVQYGKFSTLSEVASKRNAIVADLNKILKTLARTESVFYKMRQKNELGLILKGLGSFAATAGLPETLNEDISLVKHSQIISKKTREFLQNSYRTRDEDTILFNEKQRSAIDKRKWMTRIGGGGAVLVLLLVYAGWKRRSLNILTAQLTENSKPLALPNAPALIAAGTVLDKNFRIEKELGRGGMGVVYLATDLTLDRKVAIKRLLDEVSQSAEESELFVAEARMVAKLRNKHIVEIHSIFRDHERLFLVFEHVDGSPLSQYVGSKRRIELRPAKSVLGQIASGLDYAHDQKVIHRDLKPSNIMIAPNGSAKVMDFGIAHQAQMTVAKITNAQSWGTPAYMAPEQELGKISRESDIFALGVCFYEMVTGKLPFPGPNFLAQKQQAVYLPASEVLPGLPAELDAAFARVFSPEPEKRFHTAREFYAAVKDIGEQTQT